MYIKNRVQSLKDLHASADFSDPVGVIMRFTSAYTIWQMLDSEIDALPAEEKPPIAGYVLEKLGLFISYFHYAAIPFEGSHKTPPEWMEAAQQNLMKVEDHVGDFDSPNPQNTPTQERL